MESFGDERRVQQGEDWNLDILLSSSDKEYIPFIISNQRVNPHFVITVASTKYEKNLRYVKSWWNNVDNPDVGEPIPRFYQTVPQWYDEVDSIEDLPTDPISVDETKETRCLYQYTLSTEEVDEDLGHKPYHYFYFEYNERGTSAERVDSYECNIRQNFSTRDTIDWESQNYKYQITLVSGETLETVLHDIYLEKGEPEDWPNTIAAQYNYVKIQWPKALQADIDVDSPLGRIDHVEPIMTPTTIQVLNNLRNLI